MVGLSKAAIPFHLTLRGRVYLLLFEVQPDSYIMGIALFLCTFFVDSDKGKEDSSISLSVLVTSSGIR